MSDLFVDRLGNITIADGVVRLDFLRLSGLDAEKKQAQMAPSVRLAIPLAGLLQAVDMLDKVRAELLRQAQAASATAPRIPADPALTPGATRRLFPYFSHRCTS